MRQTQGDFKEKNSRIRGGEEEEGWTQGFGASTTTELGLSANLQQTDYGGDLRWRLYAQTCAKKESLPIN